MLKRKGFTLIELLVVIGVLAVLAAGVVALIDPVEKTRQANDAKIINDIGQLATALQSFAAQQNDASYPCATATVNCPNPTAGGLAGIGPAGSGELTSIPTLPGGAAYSYASTPTNARPVTAVVVYGALTSRKYTSKCSGANPTAYWAFNTTTGRACGVCATGTGPTTASTCTANF